MNRYLILEDGAVTFNDQTLLLLAKDKKSGWKVSDLLDVRIITAADGSITETADPAKGLRAAKIVLA